MLISLTSNILDLLILSIVDEGGDMGTYMVTCVYVSAQVYAGISVLGGGFVDTLFPWDY